MTGHRSTGNLVRVAVILYAVPAAAVFLSRTAVSCTQASEFEEELDKLSWGLYDNGIQGFSVLRNFSMSSGHNSTSNAAGRAAERIAEFLAATTSTSAMPREPSAPWEAVERIWRNMTRSQENAGARRGQPFRQKVPGSKSVHQKLGQSSGASHDLEDSGKSGGGYCAHHIPVDNPYWLATENYDETHHGYIKCQYSDGCKRPVENRHRVTSLRNALHGAQALFNSLEVEYLLYGGSAIGQYRCGDVIPWDVDCDVLVSKSDIEKIHRQVFGADMDWYQIGGQAGTASNDLASFSAPDVVLIKKSACTPFEIVDTKHGFFCDVFVSDWEGSTLQTPWWNGPSACPGAFPACAAAGGSGNCYAYPDSMISPIQWCQMSSEWQRCPAKMYPFLVATYGSNVNTPNRTIPT